MAAVTPEAQEKGIPIEVIQLRSTTKIRYGLMPELDYETIRKTLYMTAKDFDHVSEINTLEIGVHKGDTSRGIRDFFKAINRKHHHTGIDSRKDFKMNSPFPECTFIIGNSSEVYNQVPDESQHFLFIDGSHSFHNTVGDFMLYKDKVVQGGYIAFHDTGKQIKPFQDYQGLPHENKKDPLNYISCRLAIEKMGLLDNKLQGWELIIDTSDEKYPTGGITVIRKL